MKKIYWFGLLLVMLISCSNKQEEIKLPFFTDFQSPSGWSLDTGATFDAKVSASRGSGSILLQRVGDSWVTSDRIISDFKLPVEAGKKYTLSFKSKTETFPPPALEVYGALSSDNGFIENSDGTMCANSQKGKWESNYVVIQIPNNQMIKYFQIKILMLPKYGKNGKIWIDDIRFEAGVHLPPVSEKKPFLGKKVRIDRLGNIEIAKNGTFEPFFPIGIYTDENRKDWSIYRKTGFNMNMWASNAASVKKSEKSGLYSMMQLAQYIVPVDPSWIPQETQAKMAHLRRTLQQIRHEEKLWSNLLFYYVDNEFYHLDHPFRDVIEAVREEDHGTHPIYMLSGAYGLARMYNDYIDVTGTYVAKDGYETPTVEFFEVLEKSPGQKQPVVFAQINRGVGENFRAVVYGAIAKGAKGIGFWRDGGSAGAIEKRPVFKQLPQIAREIKQLMPLIRTPLKTEWHASCNDDKIIFGTRTLNVKGYLIVSNPTRLSRKIEMNIKGLPYVAKKVEDYFSHQKVADVNRDNHFFLTLKPHEATVLRLVP